MLLRLSRWRATALVVGVSVLASLGLTLAVELALQRPLAFVLVAASISVLIPVLVATPVAGITLGLMHDLDAARREAQRLARTDALTGALSRRHFIEVAQRELLRARREAMPLALLLLDVDDFKHVNDRAGHETGDEVLKAVSRACLAALRPGDPLARWGGEEFIALLPGAGPGEAIGVALRVRAAIADTQVPAPDGRVRVTASIGVASDTDPSEPLGALISRADRAMYAAKRGGKNAAVADRALEAA